MCSATPTRTRGACRHSRQHLIQLLTQPTCSLRQRQIGPLTANSPAAGLAGEGQRSRTRTRRTTLAPCSSVARTRTLPTARTVTASSPRTRTLTRTARAEPDVTHQLGNARRSELGELDADPGPSRHGVQPTPAATTGGGESGSATSSTLCVAAGVPTLVHSSRCVPSEPALRVPTATYTVDPTATASPTGSTSPRSQRRR